MSLRYKAISGLLEDPLNLVCVIRELQRRKVGRILLPPIPLKGGGFVLIPLKEALNLNKNSVLPKDFSGEILYTAWNSGINWFVFDQKTGEEIGPFDSENSAKKEAILWASSEGLKVIDEWPWDRDDTLDFEVR